MQRLLTTLLLITGLLSSVSGIAQNKFILQKEKAEQRDSVFSVVLPAPNTGAICVNIDSIRRAISGNRDIYLAWRRSREQAYYLINIDENGNPSNFRADGPPNEMHDWMRQYLAPMRFRPAFNLGAQPIDQSGQNLGRVNNPRASILRIALPGMEWPRFEQEYFLATLVAARCRAQKPGECVQGYVRLGVLVDANGKPMAHEVLAGENEFLNQMLSEELYKIGFKPAVSLDDAWTPSTLWGYIDFEFATRNCR